MVTHEELTLVEVGLIAILTGAIWMAIWFKLRTDARISGATSDRYLYRADLAEGAAPQNLVEVFIKAVLTRPIMVHAVLVAIALVGFVISYLLGSPTGIVTFAFLTVLFAAAAVFFLGSPYIERYIASEDDGGAS